jgi:tRNA pseudouridine38-40 synthase
MAIERYQLILAYDGTDFLGSQRQGVKRTVQGEVEAALHQIGWQGRSILLAGRTDAGVHATGQVAAVDLDWRHTLDELKAALNYNLPDDIAVWKVSQTARTFHPRFDAQARCYLYRLFTKKERDPLRERFAWRIEEKPAFDLLMQVAVSLVGEHDFHNFGRAMHLQNSTVRNVLAAKWSARGFGELEFEVTADAFLYHMVRRMVYLQVMVGIRRLGREDFQAIITGERSAPPGMAPAAGLELKACFYDAEWQEKEKKTKWKHLVNDEKEE